MRAEQKHAARQEKQKEKEADLAEPLATTAAAENPKQASPDAENRRLSAVGRVRALSISFTKRPPRRKSKESVDKSPTSDETPTSPTGKVRAWLLSRFPRPRAKSTSSTAAAADGGQEPNDTTKKGFVGGAALARMQGLNPSTLSVTGGGGSTDPKGKGKEKEAVAEDAQQQHPDSSMRSVAMAGRSRGDEPGESSHLATTTTTTTTTTVTAPAAVIAVHTTVPVRGSPIIHPSTPSPPPRPASQVSEASIPASVASAAARSVSSLSSAASSIGRSSRSSSRDSGHGRESDDDDDKFVEARSEPDISGSATKLSPPKPVGGAGMMTGRVSPFRESRFSEILE